MTTCSLNFCNRPVGAGTHVVVRTTDPSRTTLVEKFSAAICEEHWQAIKAVPYLAEVESAHD